VSVYAPRMVTFKINPEKIRDVIGKGGAVVRALSEETRCQINIEDDGTITIASPSGDDLADCKKAHRRDHRCFGSVFCVAGLRVSAVNLSSLASVSPSFIVRPCCCFIAFQ
jgi:polyribonucleotide nucleotidyltransferase